MKRDAGLIRKIYIAVWVAFSLLFMLFMIKTGRVNFETNDDVIMSQITAGVFKRHSAYNVFSNIVLGQLFVFAAKIMPGQNWPTIFDIGCVALSYTMLGVICIRAPKKPNIISLLIPFTFVLATFKTMILGINFSKVGAITFIVGFIVLLQSIDNENYKSRENILFRIMGYVMFIVGFMVRIDSVKAMLPFILVLILYFCVKNKKDLVTKNIFKTIAFKKLIHIIIPFAVVIFLWIVNSFAYGTSEWKTYNNYEKVLVDMQDFYGFPDYESHSEEYAQLGLDEHDAIMFMCYVHADDSVFSMDTIERLDEIAAKDYKRNFSFAYIKELIQSVLYLSGSQTIIIVVLIYFCVSAFMTDKRLLPYLGASVALMIAEIGYLYHINRVLERSYILPIIGAYIVIVYLFVKNGSVNEENKPAIITVVTCIMLLAYFTRGFSDIKEINSYVTPNRAELEQLDKELKSHPENLYIWDYQSYADASMQYASPLDEYSVNWMGNSLVLGAWPVEMPIMKEIAEPFGHSGNLMKILADNPNAYYVFELNNPYMTLEAMETYVRTHYNPDAVFNEVNNTGNYCIYSIE